MRGILVKQSSAGRAVRDAALLALIRPTWRNDATAHISGHDIMKILSGDGVTQEEKERMEKVLAHWTEHLQKTTPIDAKTVKAYVAYQNLEHLDAQLRTQLQALKPFEQTRWRTTVKQKEVDEAITESHAQLERMRTSPEHIQDAKEKLKVSINAAKTAYDARQPPMSPMAKDWRIYVHAEKIKEQLNQIQARADQIIQDEVQHVHTVSETQREMLCRFLDMDDIFPRRPRWLNDLFAEDFSLFEAIHGILRIISWPL